jgi:tetratricopeptide (TPR) repeat protein
MFEEGKMNRFVLFVICLLPIVISTPPLAAMKTSTRDYTYQENERLRQGFLVAKGEKEQKDIEAHNQTTKDLSAADWFEKGYSFYRSGRYNDAVNAYSKAIELNPKLAEPYQNRGLAYKSLGNSNQAINNYDKAIELNPK